MSRSPLFQLSLRLSMALILCLTLVAGLGLAGSPSTAVASSLYVVAGNSLQIPAGSTGYLQVRGISLQPGSNIPSDQLTLATQQFQAGDKTRTALYYGIDWGYSDSAPDQVALAIWWGQNGNWQSADHATAQRIVDAAASAQGIPSWNPDGRNLLTAITQGQAAISGLSLVQLQQTGWVGSGTLSVQNKSGSDLTVYLPYGTIFNSASGSALVWATGTGQPDQTTPTSLPANSPTSVATVAATATAVPKATAVQATPSPTAQLPYRKGGGQPPPQQPTNTPPPLAQTKAPIYTPTSVPPTGTDTPAPPPPADTSQPTNTPLPPSTATPLPQQSQKNQQGSNQLPPSQPQKPVQQKSNTGGSTAVGQGSTTTNQAQTSNVQSSAQPNRSPAEVPLRQDSAPLPPTPGPSATAGSSSPATGSGAAAPPPIGTAQSQGSSAPPPVDTAQTAPQPVNTAGAQATVPFPVLTVYPTAVLGTIEPTKEVVPPTISVPTVSVPTVTKPQPPATGSTPTVPAASTTDQKPTPAPTPAPPPGDNQGASGSSKPPAPPVIVVGPSSTSGGNSSASGQGPGSPPKINPVTGAGPSSMPLWLSIGAFLMLLGGWALRRAARARAKE